MPVVDNGVRVGVVRVTQSVEEVNARQRRNVLVVVGVGIIALVFGLALAWVLAGSLAEPLRALARTARRVEEGELDARAEVTGAREQREVAVAFNDMTERLGAALASQREFVGNASHQLRTPLTGIRLRLEAAGLKTREPEVARELEMAEAEVARLTRLLNALLTLAREGDRPALRAPVSLREASEAALERWLPRATDSGHELELEGDADAIVHAGEEDVAIVLDNLIENALVYSPSGTRVTVTWSPDGRLAVLDEGPGVQPGDERRVFDRFQRGLTEPSGSGLGLAIVETLVRRWGGSATISQSRGRRRVRRGRPSSGADTRAPDEGGVVTRTLLLGLFGIVLAVAVGLGVHLVTRETISLPVAKLEQAPDACSAGGGEDGAARGRRPRRRPRSRRRGEDDHGGSGGNSGPGGGNSGRGSDDDD